MTCHNRLFNYIERNCCLFNLNCFCTITNIIPPAKHDILSKLVTVEGSNITEREESKECDWCGGTYYRGFKAQEVELRDNKLCLYECYLAYDYRRTVLVEIILIGCGILFLVESMVGPYFPGSPFDFSRMLGLILTWGVGLPSLFIVRSSRKVRKEIPQHSRTGMIVEEPSSYQKP